MAITWKNDFENVQVNIGEAITSQAEVNGTHTVTTVSTTDGKFHSDDFVSVNDIISSSNDGFYNTSTITVPYTLTPKDSLPNSKPFLLHKICKIEENFIEEKRGFLLTTALHGTEVKVEVRKNIISIVNVINDVTSNFTLFKTGAPAYDGIDYVDGDLLETFVVATGGKLVITVVLKNSIGVVKETHEFTSPDNIYTNSASFRAYADVRQDLAGDNIKVQPIYYNLEKSSAIVAPFKYELQHDSVVINKLISLSRIYSYTIPTATQNSAGTYVLVATQGVMLNTTTMIITIVALDDMLKEPDRIVFEIGYSHPSSLFARWTTTNPEDIQPNSMKLKYKNTDVFINEENDNIEHIVLSPVTAEIDPIVNTWEISALTLANEIVNKQFFFEWRYVTYYGTSTELTLNEVQAKALASKELLPSMKHTYNFGTGGYKYFVLPKPVGQYTLAMYDDSNNWSVPYEITEENLSITNEHGRPSLYIVIRTFNILNNSISIRID